MGKDHFGCFGISGPENRREISIESTKNPRNFRKICCCSFLKRFRTFKGSFTCTCNDGYFGTGETCSDKDECAAMMMRGQRCSMFATCHNKDGGYECICNEGFFGNGFACMDVDECATGDNNCDANATCNNTPGGYECACNAGFIGDGNNCADIQECLTGMDNCSENAKCSNTQGGFTCECKENVTKYFKTKILNSHDTVHKAKFFFFHW